MPIEKKYSGSSSTMDPGEHRVVITEVQVGVSKSGKQMLTVVFQNDREQRIKSYYVRELVYHIKQLTDLKISCGLTEKSPAEELLHKRCGILVDPREPNEEGRVFMNIAGYGKESDVTDGGHTSTKDEIPF